VSRWSRLPSSVTEVVVRRLDSIDRVLLAELEFELTSFAGALAKPNVAIDASYLTEVSALLPERRALDAAIARSSRAMPGV
jgi:hypothetical protein